MNDYQKIGTLWICKTWKGAEFCNKVLTVHRSDYVTLEQVLETKCTRIGSVTRSRSQK